MATALTRKDDWGQLGPAMKALPNAKWRAFVEFYLLEKPGYGTQTNAARRAGFGRATTKPAYMARMALRLMRDERMIAAIAEEARKIVRAGALEAAMALINLVRDPTHKDHARGIQMVMARFDPEITHAAMQVTHRVIDPIQEELDEYRAVLALGTSREKLLELFGDNGLARLERLNAAETEQRASRAKLIEGEVVNVR
jgi:hypothetical protein